MAHRDSRCVTKRSLFTFRGFGCGLFLILTAPLVESLSAASNPATTTTNSQPPPSTSSSSTNQPPNSTGQTWTLPVPIDGKSDWIKLSSGEWLKGDIRHLRRDSFEFESDELDVLSLDWEDVA